MAEKGTVCPECGIDFDATGVDPKLHLKDHWQTEENVMSAEAKERRDALRKIAGVS